MFFLIASFCALMTYVFTPPLASLAWRMGAVDVPADLRRMHRECIARNGGLSMLLPFFLGAFLLGDVSPFLQSALLGGALMMAVGLVDDIACLGAGTKLFFQIAAALAAVLGSGFGESWAAVWLAVGWVVLLTNAHNFIDGMDGLLCGCTAVEGGMLGVTLYLSGDAAGARYAFLLVAVSLAFRVYNRYPARVFAGDCGSEAIGFLLAMLSLPLFSDPVISVENLSPLFLFAYPLTDLCISVARRILRGKSPFAADRGHLHHRIYAAGLSVPECVGMLESVCLFLGSIGIFLSGEALWFLGVGMCMLTAGLLLTCRRFLVRRAAFFAEPRNLPKA